MVPIILCTCTHYGMQGISGKRKTSYVCTDAHASEASLPTCQQEMPKSEVSISFPVNFTNLYAYCVFSSQIFDSVRPTPKPRNFVNRSISQPAQQVQYKLV